MARMAFRPDVDGLRALAVTLVVLYHSGAGAVSGGFIGVDVFFVISGFLITSLLLLEHRETGTISATRFYARRAVRLLPAASLVIGVTVLASWLWLPPVRFTDITADALATTFYAMNFRLAIAGSDYLSWAATPSPLQHFWTLAVEEQFYLLWPLLLIGVIRLGTIGLRWVLAVLAAGSLALSVWQTAYSAPWAYFGIHTRAWELAAGALVAVTAAQWAALPKTLAIAGRWLGLAGITGSAFWFNEHTPFPGYHVSLPVAATVLVIGCGCAHPQTRVLAIAPVQWLGKVSYSWYLWHWPVLVIAPFVVGQARPLGQQSPLGQLTLLQQLALAALSLALAAATFAFVENPLRHRGQPSGVPLGTAARGTGAIPARRWAPQGAGSALPSGQDPDDARAHTQGSAAPQRDFGQARAVRLSVAGSAAVAIMVALIPTPGIRAELTAVQELTVSTESELLMAVADSPRTTPANLTPALANAKNDYAAIYRDECGSALTDATVRKPCFYGDLASATTIVLFGDSHAGQWFPAAEQIATAHGWRLAVVIKSACTAASVLVHLPQLKRPYHECVRWRDSAIGYIRSLDPAIVLMSSAGDGDASAWEQTFTRLALPGTRQILILDTAWPSSDVPACVSANLLAVTTCGRPPSEAVAEPERRARIAAAASAARVSVVDPLPWMCTAAHCPVIVGNVLVYYDASHLSATYSRLLAPVLDAYLSPQPGSAGSATRKT